MNIFIYMSVEDTMKYKEVEEDKYTGEYKYDESEKKLKYLMNEGGEEVPE